MAWAESHRLPGAGTRGYCPIVADVIPGCAHRPAGKIVVEMPNPPEFDTMNGLTIPPDSSGAEETAKLAPRDPEELEAAGAPASAELAASTMVGAERGRPRGTPASTTSLCCCQRASSSRVGWPTPPVSGWPWSGSRIISSARRCT
jgi:hypothetical protein